MATPSSSATSPSPPMLNMLPQQTIVARSFLPSEHASSSPSLEKFIARAEISTVTRALRARLSYASYKASNNMSHVSLGDLEAQSLQPPVSSSPSRPVKRKAAGSSVSYANVPSQGPAGSDRRNSMAPPTSTPSTSRTNLHHLQANGNATSLSTDPVDILRQGPPINLYTSLLAPPPSKHARTIHNASDPPAQPASRSSYRSANTSVRSIAEGTRAQAKNRQQTSSSTKPGSARKERQRVKKGKGKADKNVDADGDVDMKAVATLASLLKHSRPATAGASSPRSSISSEASSQHSYSHFIQSSARTHSGVSGDAEGVSNASTVASLGGDHPSGSGQHRRLTPPPLSELASQVTPHQATDSEAADLMLFLATSPSPVRPATSRDRDAADKAAFKALSGVSRGGLRDKGRVLFPTADETAGPHRRSAAAETLHPQHSRAGLVRSIPGESSFASISSIGSEIRGVDSDSKLTDKISSPHLHPSSVFPSSPHSQLLPPPPMSISRSSSGTSSPRGMSGEKHLLVPTQPPTPTSHASMINPSPSGLSFNFGDFIHVSPFPRSDTQPTSSPGGPLKGGLRADVGRRLFEEEQTKHRQQNNDHHRTSSVPPKSGLQAGIDLVQG